MTGCSPADYRDGSYRAEAADFDQSGWKDYVQLTVSGGKVTEIEYDALNREDGRKKSEDLAYQQQYRDAGQIAPWALEAVGQMTAGGLLQGDKTGTFRPLDGSTRAQAATVLMRVADLLRGALVA